MTDTLLDARLLFTLRTVAAAGSISKGAQRLHLSQPAVTAQVHQLEESCGRPLLLRSIRGVVPTEAGRRLIAYAERVHALLEEASEAVAVDDGGGELHLAASTTIASYVLPNLLAEFARTRGDVRVRVDVGNTEEVIEQIRRGDAPLGLVEGHSRAARLRLEPFLDDELVPIVAADGPAELTRARKARDLAELAIIWREPGSGTRSVVERALRKAIGRRPHLGRDVQMGATEAIKAAALAGLGVAFLSRWSCRTELGLGRLKILEIPDLTIRRNFSWALPAGELRGLAGRFLRFARQASATLKP